MTPSAPSVLILFEAHPPGTKRSLYSSRTPFLISSERTSSKGSRAALSALYAINPQRKDSSQRRAILLSGLINCFTTPIQHLLFYSILFRLFFFLLLSVSFSMFIVFKIVIRKEE